MREPAPRRVALMAGAAVGLALGLLYTRVIDPVTPTNTYPALLRSNYRRDWVRLAALSHVAEGDYSRIRARLDGLESEDVETAMQELVGEYTDSGGQSDTISRVLALAEALDVPILATASPPSTRTRRSSASPTPTPTASTTPTAPRASPLPSSGRTRTPTSTRPDQTATPTPASTPSPTTLTPPSALSFKVTQREHVCRSVQDPHIEVVVRDADGEGIPGIRVWLLWPEGADWAVTGLKPSKGAGYADFGAVHGVTYTLGLGEIGMPLVTGLQLEGCPAREGGGSAFGSWRITMEPRAADATASPTPRS